MSQVAGTLQAVPLDWSDDPLTAGPADWGGVHLEPLRLIEVATGERSYHADDYTDPRCRAVAAVCSSFRELGESPRPETVVATLQRHGLTGPGCYAWVSRALYGSPLLKRVAR